MASQGTPVQPFSAAPPAQDSAATSALHSGIAGHRNYLNTVAAPFLKKALIALPDNPPPEFPLQWIGEYLINQSLIYENNNDSTNIKQHFRYEVRDQNTRVVNPINGAASATAEIPANSPPSIVTDGNTAAMPSEIHIITPPQNEIVDVPTEEIHLNGHTMYPEPTSPSARSNGQEINGVGEDTEMTGAV